MLVCQNMPLSLTLKRLRGDEIPPVARHWPVFAFCFTGKFCQLPPRDDPNCITKSVLQVHKFLIAAITERDSFKKPPRIVGSWSEVQTWYLLTRNTDALGSFATHHRIINRKPTSSEIERLQVFSAVEHRLTTIFNF